MESEYLKLEIFVPQTHLESVKQALYQVDAGHIGNYDCCLSYSPVMSTWRPLEAADPFIGLIGEISETAEYKIEVTIYRKALSETLRAVREAHPYEEPVINALPIFATGL